MNPGTVLEPFSASCTGHGGEDGGASSADGALESHINLAVATRLYDMLRFTGQRTIMTRSTEDAIYTEGDTIRARKVSDTHNRVSIVNHAENAVCHSRICRQGRYIS